MRTRSMTNRLITPTPGRYYCPVLLPWFRFRHSNHPGARLRTAAYDTMRARNHWLRRLRFSLQWPLYCALHAVHALRRWGAKLRTLNGVGYPRQLRDTFCLALLWNVPPHTYYLFRLWDSARQAMAGLYLQEFESQPMQRQVNRHMDSQLLRDKRLFHIACVRADLPTVDNIVVFHVDGREQWSSATARLPTIDLFLKLADGLCGKEAERWIHNASDGSWSNGPLTLDQTALIARCRELARQRPRILQPCLQNHPQLAAISTGALATLRIVTWKEATGPSRYFMACLRMGCGSAVIDNFTPGGIAAGVEPDGRLLPGARAFIGMPLDTHPDTGQPIAGRFVPHWHEARDLALRAHDVLQLPGIIGWDVAVTPRGVLLIEGNPVWGTELMQSARHEPLGVSKLPEIIGRLQQSAVR